MKKNLEKIVYDMTSDSFRIVMDTLLELEEKCCNIGEIRFDKNSQKKKIAIVYDSEGWAFYNIANEIKKYLSEYYDIYIISHDVFSDNPVKMFILAKEFDLMHCLWRGEVANIESKYCKNYIESMGFSFEEFYERYVKNSNITTTVCDHKFLNKESFETTKNFLKYVKNYITSSKILFDIYKKLNIKDPSMVINDGIDIKRFHPYNLERLKKENLDKRIIKIGWAGNSEFVDSEGDNDLKGVKKIIRPVISELQKEGYKIEEKFADRNERYIPYEEMPNYYNSIDIYVCASKTEGTPIPILEAMASGVAIVSTNVGIVEEALGKKQKEFILEKRNKEELKNKLKKILDNLTIVEELSKENLEKVKDWTWKEECEKYKRFFDENLK